MITTKCDDSLNFQHKSKGQTRTLRIPSRYKLVTQSQSDPAIFSWRKPMPDDTACCKAASFKSFPIEVASTPFPRSDYLPGSPRTSFLYIDCILNIKFIPHTWFRRFLFNRSTFFLLQNVNSSEAWMGGHEARIPMPTAQRLLIFWHYPPLKSLPKKKAVNF